MQKIKFYLNLIYLCQLYMEDITLKKYILQYVTDPEANLDWLENKNLIGWDAQGIPFLTPKGYDTLTFEPQPRINYRAIPDGKLVKTVVKANEELCRRYESNDKFCEKVHSIYSTELATSIQCLVGTVTEAMAVMDTEEDFLVTAQENLDNG